MVFFTRIVQVLMERDNVDVWVFRVRGIYSSGDFNLPHLSDPILFWRMGINTLNFSMSTKSRFCICCNTEIFVGQS